VTTSGPDVDAPAEERLPRDGSPWAPRNLWRSARTLAVATARDAVRDRAPGLAAEVAFYSLLALPPLLLALLGLLGFVADVGPLDTTQVREWVIEAAEQFLSPRTIEESIEPSVDGIVEDGRADVALLGFALALWAGSRATAIAMHSITMAYDLEPRPGWKRRLIALGLTVAGLVAGLVVIPALVLGPNLGELLDVPGFAAFWKVAYWPVVGVVAASLLATLYHVAAPWWTPWRRDLPGAVLAVAIWLAGSTALRLYAAWAIRGDTTYGSLATPIIVLLWLYLTSFAVVLGAELNSEVEKYHPLSRDEGV